MLKKVNQLNLKEAAQLLKENDNILDEILKLLEEQDHEYLQEIFKHVQPYLFDYQIDIYGYSYIELDRDNLYKIGYFVEGIEESQKNYAIFDNLVLLKCEKIKQLIDEYYLVDDGEEEEEEILCKLDEELTILEERYIEQLLEVMNNCYYEQWDILHEALVEWYANEEDLVDTETNKYYKVY